MWITPLCHKPGMHDDLLVITPNFEAAAAAKYLQRAAEWG
jgi:hypothetical protein